MTDTTIAALVWIVLTLHLIVGVVAMRTEGLSPMIPGMNVISAACVVAYWVTRWFGYLFRGITWYASDQIIPLYAVVVCVLAGLSLTGRWPAGTMNWIVCVLHAAVLLCAAVFFTFFRMNRLF